MSNLGLIAVVSARALKNAFSVKISVDTTDSLILWLERRMLICCIFDNEMFVVLPPGKSKCTYKEFYLKIFTKHLCSRLSEKRWRLFSSEDMRERCAQKKSTTSCKIIVLKKAWIFNKERGVFRFQFFNCIVTTGGKTCSDIGEHVNWMRCFCASI